MLSQFKRNTVTALALNLTNAGVFREKKEKHKTSHL